MSTIPEFCKLLSLFIAEQFDDGAIDSTEMEAMIAKFIKEANPSILNPPAPVAAKVPKAPKAATEKKAPTEKKARRSSAAKEADEIFAANPNKVVIIVTEGKPVFVAFNGAATKKNGDEIKGKIKGKGISAKDNKDYGVGLSIPAKNFDDVSNDLFKYFEDNDIEYMQHTHNKTVKAPTAYNLFQKKMRAINPGLDFTTIAEKWNESDEKKASDEAAEKKKAEAKAESERKKAEKAAAKTSKK